MIMHRCKCNPNASFKGEVCPKCNKLAIPAEKFRAEEIDKAGFNRPKIMPKGEKAKAGKPVKIEKDFR